MPDDEYQQIETALTTCEQLAEALDAGAIGLVRDLRHKASAALGKMFTGRFGTLAEIMYGNGFPNNRPEEVTTHGDALLDFINKLCPDVVDRPKAAIQLRLHVGYLRNALQAVGYGDTPTTLADVEPLTDHERAVLDLIREQQPGKGIIGKQILKTLDDRGTTIDDAYLRTCIIPRLKRDYGVKNRRGVGYYIAESCATKARQ